MNILPSVFLDALLLFTVTEILLCSTPGPAVLLTISQSMRRGFGAGIWSSFGILAANTFYFILSAVGVGALILTSTNLFNIVKYIGAAYLIYMGIRMLLPLLFSFGKNTQSLDEPIINQTEAKPESRKATFIRGFIIQASNPKNLVFFVALLPQFVLPSIVDEISLAAQFSILAIVSVLIEFIILLLYILLSVKLAKWVKTKAMLWIDGAAGIFLILIGIGLATLRKLSPDS